MTELNLPKILVTLRKYCVTNYGDNPYTPEAVVNVLRNEEHYEDVLNDTMGRLTSAYRCQRVNEAVGGDKASKHTRGLALDIAPPEKVLNVSIFKIISINSVAGKYGRVQTVILEPSWVHVSWHDNNHPPEDDGPVVLKKKVGSKYPLVNHNGMIL